MKRIFISLVMALALVSCSTDELSSGGTPASDKGSVQLVLSTDDMVSRTVDESAIQDVNILEYVNGVLATDEVVYLSGKDFSKAVNVSGLKELPATTMTEVTDADGNKVQVMQENGIENFIFVVANYGKKIEDREAVSTFAKLKAFKTNFSGKKTMTNLPMTGFYYGGINANSVTQMDVSLQRAVAKVNFTLDTSNFAVDDGSAPNQLVVNSIKLCNVPGNITLYPCQDRPSLPTSDKTVDWNSTNGHTLFPTKEEMEATGGSVTYGNDQNQSSTANTYVAYIPENVRGSYSNITNNKAKRPSKCDASITDDSKDKSYTYILVDLSYATSDGTAKNATYRIYLGGNKTGDMNLLRNTQYNITTFLYGADPNSTDTRITVKDITPADVVETVNANCYMIDMSDMPNVAVSKKVTIPLQQVINGWNYIATNSSSSITASDVQKILNSGNWEIQTEWKTWSGSSHITGTKSSDSNLKATLTIPSTVTNGHNAVVKLVSGGTTYWSWHLWFTDYKPSATGNTAENGQVHQYISNAFKSGGTYYSKYMMDRNLGATITGVSGTISQPTTTDKAIKYYGLMYQWGRKDPFIGSNGKNSSSSTYEDFVPIYDATGTRIKNSAKIPFKTDGPTTLANSVQNPGTFFYNDSGTYDWLSPQNSKLWDKTGKTKSVFDPCPPGWRVHLGGTTATDNPWAGFCDGSASSITNGNSTWSGFAWQSAKSGQSGTSGCLYSYPPSSSIQAWYPASGRLYYSDGTLGYVDSYGFYWSATPSQTAGYDLLFDSNNRVYPSYGGNDRANGFSVRCIQE